MPAEGSREAPNPGSRGRAREAGETLQNPDSRCPPAPARAGVQKVPRFCRVAESDFFRSRGESRETGRRGDFLEKKRFSPSPYILRKQRFKAVKRGSKKSEKTRPRASSPRGEKKQTGRKQPLFFQFPGRATTSWLPQDSAFWLSSEKWTFPAEDGGKKGHPGR